MGQPQRNDAALGRREHERDAIWDEVREFVTKYGAELFHAKMLTLGNVRAILHNGIPWFLNFLAESQDPLRPSPLLEALDSGRD